MSHLLVGGLMREPQVAANTDSVCEMMMMVEPLRPHTRFEKARIVGARALQISMGAPLYVTEKELRSEFRDELVSLYGVDEAGVRFVLDPLKIAMLEYEKHLIPIDVDPHLD